MLKTDKEQIVLDLTERLRTSQSLIIADYRGLTNANLASLRTELLKHGARFTVVKNTLTRRAAEAAGTDALLPLLQGPSAIAFVEADGDPAAVAKALSDAARDTKILAIRGGVLAGAAITDAQVESLAKLPSLDVLRGQLVGAIIAPVTVLVGLLAAPVRDLVGLIDARIAQLEEGGGAVAATDTTEDAPAEAVEPTAGDDPVEPAATDAAVVEDAEAPAGDDASDPAAAEDEPTAVVAGDEAAADVSAADDPESAGDEPNTIEPEKNEEE
jgi:large subunit ribosomal protein L10